MSDSDNDEYHEGPGDKHQDERGGMSNKKRKIQRACDVCRRKKIRCDGPQQADGRCTNCITYSYDCTYVEVAKKRGPPKGYVESLENRLEKMENLLKRLYPGADFTTELGPPIERNIWAKDPTAFPARAKALTGPLSAEAASANVNLLGRNEPGASDDDATDNPPFGNFSIASISNSLSNLNLSTGGHFYGRSSVFMHIQAAVERKMEHLASKMEGGAEALPSIEEMFPHFRPEYWQPNPWELNYQPKRSLQEFEFPPEDLMDSLVNIYFLSNNCHFPLLHRPTFEQQYRAGLHRTSQPFAETVLLVCAIASRCCDDPRVLLDPSVPHSAGWKYYEQIDVTGRNLALRPTLMELQRYVLASWYLLESSCNYAAWALSGIGLRLAQDVGAHRKKVYGNPISPEDELWKRAFWCLIAIDRTASSTMGRIPAIYDSDIDVDLPLEVDDEYWTASDPSQAFQQPADKPAQATAFVKLLKLSSIVAYILQTIYAVNKAQVKTVSGPLWEQHILAEVDSLLSKWVDDLPPHLQWPNQGNEHPIFFTQSTSLYAIFYHTQILAHHPFILSPKRPNPTTSFPSHQICVNAARSCSHVVDAYRKRSVYFAPWCVVGAMSSAIVLLENLWTAGTPFGPASVDVNGTMEDVRRCSDVMGIVERRWPTVGKMRDVIAFLAASDGAAFPTPDQAKSKVLPAPRRERSNTDKTAKGRNSKAAAAAGGASTSPRQISVLPPMKVRSLRGVSAANGMAHQQTQPIGVSPTDPRGAMGPPPIEFSYPTTPATWYGHESPHPDSAGPTSAGGPMAAPIAPNNNGGPGGEHATQYGYGGYPAGPSGAPPPHAQESFMRNDGSVQNTMRMPMWPSGAPATAPAPTQDYSWV